MGDRPIALWFDAHFHGSTIERLLIAAFHALDWILIVGGIGLVAAIFAVRRGGGSERLRRTVDAGTTTALALIAAQAIKIVVGRSQVYPDFLRDGIYAFRPFHGGAFPSATMAGVTAFIVALRLPVTIERPLLIVAIVAFAAALLITSGHWATDIVGGTILGVLVGRAVAPRIQARLASTAPKVSTS